MYISLIVLEQSHDFEIWIFFTFFKCHFKKRKKSRFWIFKKNVKNVFSNYDYYMYYYY